MLALLAACAPFLEASSWEWQVSLGPWTLQPLTLPVERLAERIVSDEVRELLSPLLGDFSVFGYEPKVEMRSHGLFVNAGLWRRLAAARFAIGLSASYLRFTLPFSLRDKQEIYFQGVPLAAVTTSGEGRIELRTIMLAVEGRWRIFQRGRIAAYASLGLALLRLSGDLHLPLSARIDSIIGSAVLSRSEDITLGELVKRNDDIPGWSAAPALGLSVHHQIGNSSRVFLAAGLSQGTFLAAGVAFDI